MRVVLFVFLILGGCSEFGSVDIHLCPDCRDAYYGYETCAFFDADRPWAREGMLVDNQNHQGMGIPITQSGYMHHKFCFNDTHAMYGSANPTVTGLTSNDNYVIEIQSKTLSKSFASEYEYLQGQGNGKHAMRWTFNDKQLEILFCPRDNCEKRVVEILAAANSSIVFLAFSFTSDGVSDALVAAHVRGVNVHGVMESFGSTRGQYPRLKESGVSIVLANTPGLMHAKMFLVDDAIAITGSYNPTASGTSRNAETIIITREEKVIQELRLLHESLR